MRALKKGEKEREADKKSIKVSFIHAFESLFFMLIDDGVNSSDGWWHFKLNFESIWFHSSFFFSLSHFPSSHEQKKKGIKQI